MVGSSVLKSIDGTYRVVDYPSQDEIDASDLVYMGGHIYEVDDAEGQALIQAGFTVVALTNDSWDDVRLGHSTWDDVALNYTSWDDLIT